MKTLILLAAIIIAPMFLTGCAEVMAMKQPKPFTPTCLTAGTKRSAVIGELGQPVNTETHTNSLTDVYKYVDGGSKNSGGSKTARVILYVGGDLFTCWLDQIIWMPTEKFGFSGTDHVVTIDYIKTDDDSWHIKVADDRALKGNSAKKEEL